MCCVGASANSIKNQTHVHDTFICDSNVAFKIDLVSVLNKKLIAIDLHM